MTVNDDQNNQISNERKSNLCSNVLPNEQLPHSNVVELVERPSEIIGVYFIGLSNVSNLTSSFRALRGTDKIPKKSANAVGASCTMQNLVMSAKEEEG